MTRRMMWQSLVVVGTVLAGETIPANGTAAQIAADVQPSLPTYAIPLRDGNTAVVWWDAVSDPAHPGWRCAVPAPWEGGVSRTITTLTAPAGDWRAALAEARASLTGRVIDGE